MKTRRFLLIIAIVVLAALAVAFFLTRGRAGAGPGGALPRLSPPEQALMQSLGPEQRRDVMARYAAAIAEGKKPRLADFMPQATYAVKASVAKLGTLQSYLDVNGDVVARTNVEVFPDIGGRLTELRVALGDKIAKGQLIAVIDPSKPGSSYAPSAVEAPIAGTVTAIEAARGATVSTATVLAKVGILDEVEIHANIRERDVASIRTGMKARIEFEAFAGQAFAATITHASPVLDATSRAQKIVLALDESTTRILPGMYAKVRIFTEAHVNKVIVPSSAVLERYGEYYAYVVSRKESVDRVELRKITKGLTVDDKVEVASGLAAGDTVVTAGQSALSDGALVRIVSAEGGAR
jgi:membrane fusion protein (multidrug efflux system)